MLPPAAAAAARITHGITEARTREPLFHLSCVVNENAEGATWEEVPPKRPVFRFS